VPALDNAATCDGDGDGDVDLALTVMSPGRHHSMPTHLHMSRYVATDRTSEFPRAACVTSTCTEIGRGWDVRRQR
jgi:hypothetical protein